MFGIPNQLVFVGTYTAGASEGIYVYRLDGASGALELINIAPDIENPSYLEIHPSGRFLPLSLSGKAITGDTPIDLIVHEIEIARAVDTGQFGVLIVSGHTPFPFRASIAPLNDVKPRHHIHGMLPW